ncbi:hypothetical protein O1611_g2353 [Lasiodiplodia mahajangana]|uniref:Uncharacterized protein n=1 Tax=Lasiodiplodia mahajangana TaxID=1108764 RepID=A0ACC2JUS3_9PEZI|nr:hypothetical protein O1611_g2353 [Lasiodiplodia mahajangana]
MHAWKKDSAGVDRSQSTHRPDKASWEDAPEVVEGNNAEVSLEAPIPVYPNDGLREHNIRSLAKGLQGMSGRRFILRHLVAVLSILIVVLFGIVVGLAVDIRNLYRKTRVAESRLSSLQSNLSDIDRGCSANPTSVTTTLYESQSFGSPTFEIFCNTEVHIPPVQSLFVSNFDECIDACASYSFYTAGNFPNFTSSVNSTCDLVTFVPMWTNRSVALQSNAPGNCYLKPGPLTNSSLVPDIVHVAVLKNQYDSVE